VRSAPETLGKKIANLGIARIDIRARKRKVG